MFKLSLKPEADAATLTYFVGKDLAGPHDAPLPTLAEDVN
jgi:hypothetical protein